MQYDPPEYYADWRVTRVSCLLLAVTWIGMFAFDAANSAGTVPEGTAQRITAPYWCSGRV